MYFEKVGRRVGVNGRCMNVEEKTKKKQKKKMGMRSGSNSLRMKKDAVVSSPPSFHFFRGKQSELMIFAGLPPRVSYED